MKYKYQRGDSLDFLMIWLLFVCIVFGMIAVSGLVNNNEFDGWANACTKQGGYIKHTADIDSDSEWYDCVKDGKMYVIPGYEKEQYDRPAGLPTEGL